MTKYIAYLRDDPESEIDMKIVKYRIGKERILRTFTDLRKAIRYTTKHYAVLVLPTIGIFGNPKEVFETLEEVGQERLICCDMPYLNEESICFIFAYMQIECKIKSLKISEGFKAKAARGEVIGNTFNLSHEGRLKGAQANRTKLINSPEYQAASEEILRLRSLGATLEDIAERLNEQGMRTTKGKHWAANSVHRVCVRHNIVSG